MKVLYANFALRCTANRKVSIPRTVQGGGWNKGRKKEEERLKVEKGGGRVDSGKKGRKGRGWEKGRRGQGWEKG